MEIIKIIILTVVVVLAVASTTNGFYQRKTFKDYCRNVDGDSENFLCSDFEFNSYDHVELNLHDQTISTADLVQFQNCTMRKFPKVFFKKFHWVVNLRINNCKLRNVTLPDKDADNLENIERIVELNYRKNQIESLPNLYFHYFTNLAKLDISYNAFKEITSSTFEYAVGLKMLYLESNSISNVDPDAFKNIVNLTSIVLSNNKMKVIPAALFKNNKKLQVIDLNDNDLEFLPVDLFQGLDHLEFLRLDNNPLRTQTFSPQLLALPALVHLNLSSTDLKMNDEMFTKCTNLESLDISRNSLKSIDSHIFRNLKNLIELYINGNDVNEFDYKNEIFKKEGFEFQIDGNNWKCSNLKDMLIYFDANKISHHPPKNRAVDVLETPCLRGIQCYGEFSYDKYSDYIDGDVSAQLAEKVSAAEGVFIATIVLLTLFAVFAIAIIVVLVLNPDFILSRFRRGRSSSSYTGNSFENNSEILAGDQLAH